MSRRDASSCRRRSAFLRVGTGCPIVCLKRRRYDIAIYTFVHFLFLFSCVFLCFLMLFVEGCSWRVVRGELFVESCSWRVVRGGLFVEGCSWRIVRGGQAYGVGLGIGIG